MIVYHLQGQYLRNFELANDTSHAATTMHVSLQLRDSSRLLSYSCGRQESPSLPLRAGSPDQSATSGYTKPIGLTQLPTGSTSIPTDAQSVNRVPQSQKLWMASEVGGHREFNCWVHIAEMNTAES